MDNRIQFQNLAFKPKGSEVYFMNMNGLASVDDMISREYDNIRHEYRRHGLTFVHLPTIIQRELVEEKMRYYAPYLSSFSISPVETGRAMLEDHLMDGADRFRHGMGLLFNAKKNRDVWTFDMIDLEEARAGLIVDAAEKISELRPVRLKKSLDINSSCMKFMMKMQDDHVTMDLPVEMHHVGEDAEMKYRNRVDEEVPTVAELMENGGLSEDIKALLKHVERMRMSGVPLAAIHEIIDKGEKLSEMWISMDNRIFLPDYNNMEIEMNDLPKALYFLFLRYPKGIRRKEMTDYAEELSEIYEELSPTVSEETRKASIARLCDPLQNSFSENMSRIVAAFCAKFDKRLAENYFPVRNKSTLLYTIAIDRKMVLWVD